MHFEDRDSACVAMRALNGKEVGAANIEVSLKNKQKIIIKIQRF